MLTVQLQNVAKRYKWEWIFRQLSYTFEAGQSYAIEGQNGAGKSTLMQIIAAYLSPSEGSAQYQLDGKTIDGENLYTHAAMAAPYTGLIEEYTLTEMLDFQQQFKRWQNAQQRDDIARALGFSRNNLQKPLKFFSSGMRQRVKLALAICSDAPLLLLDEPTITLDTQGADWFQSLLQSHNAERKRTLVIASNVESDFAQCSQRLRLWDYK